MARDESSRIVEIRLLFAFVQHAQRLGTTFVQYSQRGEEGPVLGRV